MPHNRPIVLAIIILLVVTVVLLGFLWWPKPRLNSRPVQENKSSLANSQNDAKKVTDIFFTKPEASPDERIILYGGSLATGNDQVLSSRLENALGYKVEIQPQPSITSRQAVSMLMPIIKKPPKVLILDITRYDEANGIPLGETTSNLSLVLAKFRQIGVRAVVLAGLSSNGNTQLAALLKPAIEKQGAFVDASIFLLSSAYRTSPTELNRSGAEKLAEELVKVLSPSPSS